MDENRELPGEAPRLRHMAHREKQGESLGDDPGGESEKTEQSPGMEGEVLPDWDKLARTEVNDLCDWLELFIPPRYEASGQRVQHFFGPDTRGRVAEKLAPILEKYQGKLPPWLVQFMPEIKLGMVVIPIAVQTFAWIQYCQKNGVPDGQETTTEGGDTATHPGQETNQSKGAHFATDNPGAIKPNKRPE